MSKRLGWGLVTDNDGVYDEFFRSAKDSTFMFFKARRSCALEAALFGAR